MGLEGQANQFQSVLRYFFFFLTVTVMVTVGLGICGFELAGLNESL